MLRLDIWALTIAAAALAASPQPAHGLQSPQATPPPPTRPRAPRALQDAQTQHPTPAPHERPSRAEPVSHSSEVSDREASVSIELADGNTVSITLRGGEILLNGESIGRFTRGFPLDRAFRALLARAGSLGTDELVFGLRTLPIEESTPAVRQAWATVVRALPPVGVTALPEPSEETPFPDLPDINAAVEEAMRGVAPVIARQIEGDRTRRLAPARLATDVAGLLGTLIALSALGFGAIFFVPQRLEVVADTVARSPGRSFLAGLCAQPLILPALVTLLIALALTIVGILVVPVAIIAFALALAAGIVGGYLAVARVVGEIYVKRRGLQGSFTGGWTTYRYALYGLIGLLAIWVPAVLLRSLPGIGLALLLAAAVFTWIMVSAGLGAVILSRAGTRTTFGSGTPSLLATGTGAGAGAYWTASQPMASSTGEARNP